MTDKKIVDIESTSGTSYCDCCGAIWWEDVTIRFDGATHSYGQDNHLSDSYWDGDNEFMLFLYGLVTGKNIEVKTPCMGFTLEPHFCEEGLGWVVFEIDEQDKIEVNGVSVEVPIQNSCTSQCDGCESRCIGEVGALAKVAEGLLEDLGYEIRIEYFDGGDI